MDPKFIELINQLKYLEKTTDSKQGILYLITDAVKEKRLYKLNNNTIREAVEWCHINQNWTHPFYGNISKWNTGEVTDMSL